jgi:hypothetical protein
MILGWDWLSTHDLRFLYPHDRVTGAEPQGSLGPPAPHRSSASTSFGAHRPRQTSPHAPVRGGWRTRAPGCGAGWSGWPRRSSAGPPRGHVDASRPTPPAPTVDRRHQVACRRHGALVAALPHVPPPMLRPPWRARTAPPSRSSRLSSQTPSEGNPPLSPDRGIERDRVLATGNQPMPRTRLLRGGLAELRRQRWGLLDRGSSPDKAKPIACECLTGGARARILQECRDTPAGWALRPALQGGARPPARLLAGSDVRRGPPHDGVGLPPGAVGARASPRVRGSRGAHPCRGQQTWRAHHPRDGPAFGRRGPRRAGGRSRPPS